jgi:hypothetical protein
MTGIATQFREESRVALDGWNRFWFTPESPHTLAVIRILAGSMLFYTHLVWGFELDAFLGNDGWLPIELAQELRGDGYGWSHLFYIESPAALWSSHVVALIIFALLTVGLWTRFMAVLAWLITVSYCHRLNGAFFGLDQVNAMLAMYLILGGGGGAYSIDRWRASRGGEGEPKPTVGTNIAIRLIQLHLCVIYLFGGIAKMRGQMWWDGSAVWYALANLEYQSLDLTWLVHHAWFVSLLTHVTVFWETFYCALIWPRRTRPVMLLIAAGVHGGIAAALGMVTFGIAMLFANVAFVPASIVRTTVERCHGLLVEWQASTVPVESRTRKPR